MVKRKSDNESHSEPRPSPKVDSEMEATMSDVQEIGIQKEPERPKSPLSVIGADRYDMGDELGRGGMGRVFRVWDKNLDRTLAMKVVTDGSSADKPGPRRLKRFLIEAKITGQLDHPGVVPVHELGEGDDGRPFFTMRMVQGDELKKIFDYSTQGIGGWNQVRVLEIFVKICDTLGFAHARNIIHRDLKPSNIMVGIHGEVYVMDWGLAKDLQVQESKEKAALETTVDEELAAKNPGESTLHTMVGTVLGTLAYMPPEQARGDVQSLSTRSDVYSIGAMLYEFLAGRLPHELKDLGNDFKGSVQEILDTAPPPLDTVQRRVPNELVAICEKAMAKNPADRYPTADALGKDLRAYLENRVVEAHRTGPWVEFRKWLKRNRAMALGLVGTLSAVLLGLSVVILLQWAYSDIIDNNAYLARINAASWHLEEHEVVEAQSLLDACPPNRRDWEWGYLKSLIDTSDHQLQVASGAIFTSVTNLGVNSDLDIPEIERRIYFGGEGGRIHYWTPREPDEAKEFRVTSGGVFARRTSLSKGVLALALSQRGDLAIGSEDGWNLISDWQANELYEVGFGIKNSRVLDIKFIEGGSRALAISNKGSINTILLGTSRGVSSKSLGRMTLTSAILDPSNQRVAVAGPVKHAQGVSHFIRIFKTSDHQKIAEVKAHEGIIFSLKYDSTRTRLVSAGGDDLVHVWSYPDLKLITTLRGHKNRVLIAKFDSTGKHILTGSGDRTFRVWDAETGEQLFLGRGHTREIFTVEEVALSSENSSSARTKNDVTYLSAGREGMIRTWKPFHTDRIHKKLSTSFAYHSLRLSSDGKELAASGASPLSADESSIEIRSTSDFKILKTLKGHLGKVHDLSWVPSDKSLISVGMDGTIRIWPRDPTQQPEVLRPNGGALLTLEYEPQEKLILCGSEQGSIFTFDYSKRKPLKTFKKHEKGVSALALHPTGRWLVSGGKDHHIVVWDLETSQAIHHFKDAHEAGISSLEFTSDGEYILSASRDKMIRVWELSTGKLVRTFARHPEGILDLKVSASGRRLFTGAWDGAIRIFDIDSGELLTTLRGHSGKVNALEFTVDGETLISVGEDRTLKTWQSNSGRLSP